MEDDGLEDARSLERQTQGAGTPVVTIFAAHRSKGLEWPAVRLWGDFTPIDGLLNASSKSQRAQLGERLQTHKSWDVCHGAKTRATHRPVLPPELESSLAEGKGAAPYRSRARR